MGVFSLTVQVRTPGVLENVLWTDLMEPAMVGPKIGNNFVITREQ